MDVMKLICYFLNGSVQWQTSFLYQDTVGHDATAPTDLKDAFVPTVSSAIVACMSNDTKLGCVQVVWESGTNVPNLVSTQNILGAVVSDALPATNAMVVNRRTNWHRKSVVRNFFSGLPVLQITDGYPDSGLAATLNTLGQQLLDPIGTANRFVPVIFDNSSTYVQPVRFMWQPSINCLRSRAANPCTVT